ncbi:MAG TPA: helix-turn-helix domain-containing protein [Caulobacteraceae bacterium]|jgi:phage repressor protein C with HTH and peptisase S24 domain
MASTVSPEQAERELTGRALRRMREDRGLFQGHVAKKMGMTSQAWQKYEAGERRFGDKLPRILEAIGATEEDLRDMRAALLGGGVRLHSRGVQEERRPFTIDVYGRARAGPQGVQSYDVGEPLRTIDISQILGPSTNALEIAGDSMVPWGDPGEIVLFDRDRYPKRGTGCVIETLAGEYYVKLYERSDGSTLFARELSPEDRIVTFALKDLRGVYAIRLRGD